jgi:hypothetical protein
MSPAAFLSLSICRFARIDYSSNNLWAEARFYLWAEKDCSSTHSFSIRPPDLGGRGAYFNLRRQSIIWSFHNGGGTAYVSSSSSARTNEAGDPIIAAGAQD